MNRSEVIDFAMANSAKAVAFVRRYRKVDQSVLEDCQQEAFLAVLEAAAEAVKAIEGGELADDLIFKLMRRGAGRALQRHFANVKRSSSLDASLSEDEDGGFSLGSMLVYSRKDDPETLVDAKRVAKTMECLDGQELGILMAFADGVELGEVAKENSLKPVDVLALRARAVDKVQRGLTGLMAEKLALAVLAKVD